MSDDRAVFRWLSEDVVNDLEDERARQEEKFPGQKLPNGTGGFLEERRASSYREVCQLGFAEGNGTWALVLSEEWAEALAESDPKKLRAELIQVAAVCLRWITQLDEEAK